MKLFLSWSGERSRALAKAFADWIPLVLQAIEPFYSEEIDKGARWEDVILKALAESSHGLVFLTPENLQSPWILFEAGALSKHVGKARIFTVLLDLKPADVRFPLAQFQHTGLAKDDVLKLVRSLNAILSERGLDPRRLETTFSMFWPMLDQAASIAQTQSSLEVSTPVRTSNEILEELLELARQTASRVSRLDQVVGSSLSESEAMRLLVSDESRVPTSISRWLEEFVEPAQTTDKALRATPQKRSLQKGG